MNRLKELRKEKGITQAKLANIIGVSRSAISMYEIGASEPDFEILDRLAASLGVTSDYLRGKDVDLPRNTNGCKWIPVYGEIAAGIPIEAIEDIVDEEEISAEMAAHGEYIALRIKGDSMSPRIQSGDVVIIRIQEAVENGEVAAVLINGDRATLKTVKKEKNGVWLLTANPAYSPVFYTCDECESLPITIIGKMVEFRAKKL